MNQAENNVEIPYFDISYIHRKISLLGVLLSSLWSRNFRDKHFRTLEIVKKLTVLEGGDQKITVRLTKILETSTAV